MTSKRFWRLALLSTGGFTMAVLGGCDFGDIFEMLPF
jgi:hypothetical protein